jgi:hypothetical protein
MRDALSMPYRVARSDRKSRHRRRVSSMAAATAFAKFCSTRPSALSTPGRGCGVASAQVIGPIAVRGRIRYLVADRAEGGSRAGPDMTEPMTSTDRRRRRHCLRTRTSFGPPRFPYRAAFAGPGGALLVPSASAFSCSYSLALMAPESSRAFAEAILSAALALPPFDVATLRM